jgi:hypothetical protein
MDKPPHLSGDQDDVSRRRVIVVALEHARSTARRASSHYV